MSITIDENSAIHCLRLLNGANIAGWDPKDIIAHGTTKAVLTQKLVELKKLKEEGGEQEVEVKTKKSSKKKS